MSRCSKQSLPSFSLFVVFHSVLAPFLRFPYLSFRILSCQIIQLLTA